MSWIANARMYAVTPEVEARWRELLGYVARDAGVELGYVPYPAPQPLEDLWKRDDLGAVFMCGFPIALGLAPVIPLAAPIPRAPWARGRAVYRTDLIVRADAPYARSRIPSAAAPAGRSRTRTPDSTPFATTCSPTAHPRARRSMAR